MMEALPFTIKSEISFTPAKKGTAIACEVLYECDPEKNTECKKTFCHTNTAGGCHLTKNIDYAKHFK